MQYELQEQGQRFIGMLICVKAKKLQVSAAFSLIFQVMQLKEDHIGL